MRWKKAISLGVALIATCALTGCIIIPNATPEKPFINSSEVKVLDASTGQDVSAAKVVLVAQRLGGYFPDGKPGAEKCPSVIVERLDQASRITLTDREVYFFPFFATGTAYGRKAAWIFKEGYAPVVYPYGETGVPVTANLRPCGKSQSETLITKMLSDEISQERWKSDAVNSLRSQLK